MPGKAMLERLFETPLTTVEDVAGTIPSGGTGANAGGWANSTNRNTALTTLGEIKTQLNALLAELRDLGLLAGTPTKKMMIERIYDGDLTTINDVAGTIPSGGTGATAGGWDTAGHRDTAIATMTEMKTQLNALLTSIRSRALLAGGTQTHTSMRYRVMDRAQATIADVSGSIPAGGTGAAGGCYDTAGNRNTMITTAGEIRSRLNELLQEMRARGWTA